MSVGIHATFVQGIGDMQVQGVGWVSLLWIPATALLGFAMAEIFAGQLHLPRRIFLIPYVTIVSFVMYLFMSLSGLSLKELVQHNWVWGVVGAVLVGMFLIRNVLSQPASTPATGLLLILDLLWSGVVYGLVDALLLSVLPVLAVWQAFSSLGWIAAWPVKIAVGVLAFTASLLVTVCYHLGYPEYRVKGGVFGPTIGNGIMTIGYLLTNNPISAILSHIAMHIAGVLHGPDSVMQLPPHYLPATTLPGTRTNQESEKAPSLLIPIFKLPVFLYRLRLGWILGNRFMRVTHIGRRSRKVRETILAVLRFDEKTKEIYAVSAWKGSDWYYNIQAVPALQVETGFVKYAPVQRTLSPEEITTVFMEYRKEHPLFSRMICRIPGWKWDSTYEEFLELASTLRGVAFRPK